MMLMRARCAACVDSDGDLTRFTQALDRPSESVSSPPGVLEGNLLSSKVVLCLGAGSCADHTVNCCWSPRQGWHGVGASRARCRGSVVHRPAATRAPTDSGRGGTGAWCWRVVSLSLCASLGQCDGRQGLSIACLGPARPAGVFESQGAEQGDVGWLFSGQGPWQWWRFG